MEQLEARLVEALDRLADERQKRRIADLTPVGAYLLALCDAKRAVAAVLREMGIVKHRYRWLFNRIGGWRLFLRGGWRIKRGYLLDGGSVSWTWGPFEVTKMIIWEGGGW